MAAVQIEAPSAHRPFEIDEPSLAFAGAFAASADGLAGWVAHSAEGRVCVYARAGLAPRGVADRARVLMVQGLITLRRTRHSLKPSLFDFQARRTALPIAQAKPVPSGERLAPDLQRLFDVLVRFADSGEPLPANDVLAAMLGARGGRSISAGLTRLSRAALVRVHAIEVSPERRIEIIETGAMTGVSE